jgi:O-antigen ligase
LIALGLLLDPIAAGKFIWPKNSNVQGLKAAFIKGFSSDITWITGHLILVNWLGLTAVLQSSPRRPLFYGGLVSAAAGLWVVTQTFQVMAFFVIFVSTVAFAAAWFCKRHGRHGVWGVAVLVLLMAGGIAYRDLVLHPQKKTFHGMIELITTGKTSNTHIQSRLNGIRWALEKWKERPFLGWGPGREILRKVEPKIFNITDTEAVRDPARQLPVGHLHDQFADLLIRVGIVGLAAYLLFLAAIYRRAVLARPWSNDWKRHPGACLQLGALIGMTFALIRLLTETYPASSVAVQYWMVLAFAALPAVAWDTGPLFVRNKPVRPR